jgi:hypothetical protein
MLHFHLSSGIHHSPMDQLCTQVWPSLTLHLPHADFHLLIFILPHSIVVVINNAGPAACMMLPRSACKSHV